MLQNQRRSLSYRKGRCTVCCLARQLRQQTRQTLLQGHWQQKRRTRFLLGNQLFLETSKQLRERP